jgi:hypothetical protein
MWATYLRSASSGYHAEFHEGCYQNIWQGNGMGVGWHV